MLCSALCGWGGAFVLSSLLLAKGEIKDMEDLRALLFLSLAPGVIIDLLVNYFLSKDKTKSANNKTSEERLMDLKVLLDKGLINQDEFDKQKTKILNE